MRKLWHFATQHSPEREGRLLAFAGEAAEEGAPEGAEATTHTTIDAATEGTRSAMHDALGGTDTAEGAESHKPFHEEVVEKAREVDGIFREVESFLKEERLKEFINTQDNDVKESYAETRDFLSREKWRIEGHLLYAEAIDRWMNGTMDDTDAFLAIIGQSYQEEDGGKESVKKILNVFKRHRNELDNWNNLSPEERRIVIDDVSMSGGLDTKLENINAIMDIYKEQAEIHKKQMELMDKYNTERMQNIQAEAGPSHKGMSIRGLARGFFSEIGVEFYSPIEVWDAFKLIKENWVKAYKEKAQLKSGVLAKNLLKVVKWAPYGKEVEIALDRDVDHKHTAAANEFKEHLEHEDEKWPHLFGEHSLLDDMIERGEKDKALGIIEYAATRGWLYDIDESASLPVNEIKILGRRLEDICPNDWSHTRMKNFHTLIRGKNMSGVNSEIENNTKKVQGIENTPYFIARIDEEMKNKNLWAVVGIAARAIDRGLKAEVCPWVMTTVMRHLEKDSLTRKYASLIFIDKLGKLSAYRSAFTLGTMQANRPAMMEWIKSGKSLKDAPIFGATFDKLRTNILHACEGTPEDKDLDRAMAYVLSANILDEKAVHNTLKLKSLHLKHGESISIYDDDYDSYRHNPSVIDINPQSPGLSKEDTDYFFQITENQYGGELIYESLFAGDGRGGFTNSDRLPDFIGLVLKQYEDLNAHGKENVAEKFRSEVGKKIDYMLTKSGLNDSRTGGMYLVKLRQHRTGEFMTKVLAEEGFFDIKNIMEAYWDARQGASTSLSIMQQIDKPLADKIQKAREAKPKDEAAYKEVLTEFYKKCRKPNWESSITTPAKKVAPAKIATNEHASESHLQQSI